MDKECERYYDFLIDLGFTARELSIAMCLNGTHVDTFKYLLYWQTGYRSIEQLEEAEGIDEEESD